MMKKQKNKIIIIIITIYFGILLLLSNIFAYSTSYFSWSHNGTEANAVIYSSNAYGNWGMMTSYTRLSSNNATNTSVYRIYVHDYTTNNPYYVYYPAGTYVQMWVNGNYVKYHAFNTGIRIYGTGYYQWFSIDVTLTNGVANEIKLYNSDGGGVQTRYFTPPASIYNVYYNANGGINAPPTQNFKFNSNEKISKQIPTREGYTFQNWLSNPNNKYFSPGENIPYDWASFQLIAQWEINKYTISFDTNGGRNIDNQIIDYGGKIMKPQNPTKDNFIFEGWYIDKTLKNKYDFNDVVTSDLVLYAKWISYPKITTKYDRYFLVQENFDIEEIKSKIKAVDEYNNDISNRIVVTGFENIKIGVVGDYIVLATVKTDLGNVTNATITIHISNDMPMEQIRAINQNTIKSLNINSKWWTNIEILKSVLEKDNVIDTITVVNK